MKIRINTYNAVFDYDQFISQNLGLEDQVTEYQSRYPIYVLSKTDPDGLWKKLQKHYEDHAEGHTPITENDITEYHWKNPDVAMEMDLQAEILKSAFYMKYHGIVYSYSIGPSKETEIVIRFYFDIDKLINS